MDAAVSMFLFFTVMGALVVAFIGTILFLYNITSHRIDTAHDAINIMQGQITAYSGKLFDKLNQLAIAMAAMQSDITYLKEDIDKLELKK